MSRLGARMTLRRASQPRKAFMAPRTTFTGRTEYSFDGLAKDGIIAVFLATCRNRMAVLHGCGLRRVARRAFVRRSLSAR
ncbi:hypothetical protein BN2476_110259 [Paraburkholderia piptadeniae]|uniref:Uncharacterized protein n=1 Tax=Paraburkholderia piptadeniae TaxID=1701573 RepID=A0A1N7RQK1_9BURK|nr:hypothetical protein BN2476_110259 [Paraburkholderia piptadeniae]